MSKFKNAAFAVTAGLCLAANAPAGATNTNVFLQTAGIYNPGTTYVTTGATTTNDYASDVIFHANFGTAAGAPSFDLIGFCVDLFHNINVGVGYQYGINLPYHVAPLLTDASGHVLTTLQKREIGGLAAKGVAIQNGNSASKYADLAAIQGAIWTIEYPNSTIAASGGPADLQSRINGFVALAPSLHGTPFAIYPTAPGHTQGFVIGNLFNFNGSSLSGAVPEPETWALFAAGFGLVGVARRKRGPRATAA